MTLSEHPRVIVAPDKFKGSLAAADAASALARGIRSVIPGARIELFPIADGGEGTVDMLLARGYSPMSARVSGPLGTPVHATYAMSGPTAVMEVSSVAGLALLSDEGPSPESALVSSTYGVGELIADALGVGATSIVIGLGGSASTDGGAGALEALGARIHDADGRPVARGGQGLAQAVGLDLTDMDKRLQEVDLVLACDVDNPLYGPQGAAHVYAPQKGADTEAIDVLDAALRRWADVLTQECGYDLSHAPGSGAAGGLAMGMACVLGARIMSGIDVLMSATGFRDAIAGADLVLVGEGSLDQQSLRGKGPIGVARVARILGVRVVGIAGRSLISRSEALEAGLSRVYTLSQRESDQVTSMANAALLLEQTGTQIARDML